MLIQIPGGLFSFSKAVNLWPGESWLHGFPICDVEAEMLQNDSPFSACWANNAYSRGLKFSALSRFPHFVVSGTSPK